MGLLENLAQGLASAAGATDSAEAIQKNKDNRQATQHEELEATTKQLFDDLRGLQQRKLKLNPQSPSYQTDSQSIDAEMEKARSAFHDLYHPAKNPGALNHLGKFINQHLLRQPEPPATPGQAKQDIGKTLSQLDSAASVPSAPDNPILVKRQQMKEAGFTPDQISKIEQIDQGLQGKATPEKQSNYVREDGVSADGKPMSVWRNRADPSDALDSTGQAVDPEILKGFRPTPKGAAGSAPKVGSLGEFLTNAYGPHPTPKQEQEGKRLWMQSGAGTTTGTHMIAVPQMDGSIRMIQVETTSTKSFGTPPASVAKTPAEAKGKAAPPASGPVKSGDTVGGRMTAPVVAAKKDYDAAVKLDSLANQVEGQHDPGPQRQLVLALIKAMAGRVNMQEYEIYTKKMGVENTVQGLINGISTGEMPAGIVQQIVKSAHANLKASKDALDAAQGTTPSGETSDVEDIVKALKGK
jgi:hypothetical protein